jgi:hypothetical protein
MSTHTTDKSKHAEVLAAEGGPAFLGGAFQLSFGYLHTIERLTEAFRSGGGVPQSAYPAETWEAWAASRDPSTTTSSCRTGCPPSKDWSGAWPMG